MSERIAAEFCRVTRGDFTRLLGKRRQVHISGAWNMVNFESEINRNNLIIYYIFSFFAVLRKWIQSCCFTLYRRRLLSNPFSPGDSQVTESKQLKNLITHLGMKSVLPSDFCYFSYGSRESGYFLFYSCYHVPDPAGQLSGWVEEWWHSVNICLKIHLRPHVTQIVWVSWQICSPGVGSGSFCTGFRILRNGRYSLLTNTLQRNGKKEKVVSWIRISFSVWIPDLIQV